jgi:hypothetical protein
MKATELRIGNWVNGEFINGEFLLSQIFRIDGNDDCSGLEPIPLTTKLLEKCGFIKDDELFDTWTEKYHVALNINFDLRWYDDGFKFMNVAPNLPIKHLHQLQNLYYALTGEELQINL